MDIFPKTTTSCAPGPHIQPLRSLRVHRRVTDLDLLGLDGVGRNDSMCWCGRMECTSRREGLRERFPEHVEDFVGDETRSVGCSELTTLTP